MLRQFFCRHEWKTAERIVCRSRNIRGPIEMSEYLFERLLRGVTTLIRVCDRCGAQEKIEVLGAWE